MYRIQWPRVIILALAVGLAVAAVRGCVYAAKLGGSEAEGSGGTAPADSPIVRVRVYDHREEQLLSSELEAYLAHVVAAEMPASFAEEALKAQAVAARTYTVYTADHGGCTAHGADVCTDSGCCQAYASEARLRESWGEAYEANWDKVSAAVRDTRGLVLLYEGRPIDALYHSASGGATEDSENVFRHAEPYLRSVESANESGTARLAGTVAVTDAAFVKRINAAYPAAKLTKDGLSESVRVMETTAAGRVQLLKIGRAAATGREMRALFGLDSTLFTLEMRDGQVLFHTKGFGHGVGMSQTGANGMALGGRTFDEILLYYYTGVTIGSIAGG